MEGYTSGAQPAKVNPTTVENTEPVLQQEDHLSEVLFPWQDCFTEEKPPAVSKTLVGQQAPEASYNFTGATNPFKQQRLPIPQPNQFKASALDQTTAPDLNVSNECLFNYHFNDSTCTPPSLDKDNISQSLSNFEKYCDLIQVPLAHKRRLLLAELKRCCESSFLSFLNFSDNTYSGLKTFILRRFDAVARIHNVKLNPTWVVNDAFTQFSNAVDLYDKTPPHEFVKFLVLRTSPIPVQQSMQGDLNLPYEEFYKKYKAKLIKYNKNNVFSTKPLLGNVNSCTPETIKKQTLNTHGNLCSYHKLYNENARNCSYKNCPMSHLVPAAIERYQSSFSNPKNDKQQKQN